MKKIILILTMIMSVGTFGVTLQDYITNYDLVKTLDTYQEILTASKLAIETYDSQLDINYLKGSVEMDVSLWDALETKQNRESFIMALLTVVENKTGSTNIMVDVDYTTVFWVSSGTIITKRIF